MPHRLCLERTCPNPATYRGRCQRHQRERNRDTHRNRTIYNSKRWAVLRRSVLYVEPLCRTCKAEGHDTVATDVDHVTPIEQGGDPWARANCQPLCKHHHSVKTRREQVT